MDDSLSNTLNVKDHKQKILLVLKDFHTFSHADESMVGE